jgi:hypothetical protein
MSFSLVANVYLFDYVHMTLMHLFVNVHNLMIFFNNASAFIHHGVCHDDRMPMQQVEMCMKTNKFMVEKVPPWLFWRCKCPTFRKQFVNSMWLYEFGHIVYMLCSKVQCRHINNVNICLHHV